MPMTSVNQLIRDALDFKPDRVLPLLCLGDETAFSAQVQENLRQLSKRDVRDVVVCHSYQAAPELAEGFYEADFIRKIAPLELWEGQPVWCLWIIGSESSYQEYLKYRAEIESNPLRSYKHFVFVKLADVKPFAKRITDEYTHQEHFIFLLSETGALNREEKQLAGAVAVYAFSGWMRYCEQGTGRLREALDLSGNEMLFTLGVGEDSPDYEYYEELWTQQLISDLVKIWQEEAVPAHMPPFESRKEILTDILPDKTYRTDPVNKHIGPAISFPRQNETFKLIYKEDLHTPGFSAKTVFWKWGKRIALLRKLVEFLRFIVVPSVQVFIASRIHRFGEGFQKRFHDFFSIKGEPAGLFADLKSRIHQAQDYLKETSNGESLKPDGMRSIEANIRNIKQKVMATPSIKGALLRLLLVGVGLTWLFIGSWIWGTGINPLNDGPMMWVAILAGISLIIMTVLVFSQWYIFSRGSQIAEQIARKDIIDSHLVAIAELIVRRISERCSLFISNLTKLEQDCMDLQDYLADGNAKTIITRQNTTPGFDRGFEFIYQQVGSDLVAEVHRLIKTEMESGKWPDLTKKYWKYVIQSCAGQCTEKILSKLPYDKCAEAAQFSDNQKEDIVDIVVRQAIQPAYPMKEDLSSPVWLFVPPDWGRFMNERGPVISLGLGTLLAVSPIPVVVTRI